MYNFVRSLIRSHSTLSQFGSVRLRHLKSFVFGAAICVLGGCGENESTQSVREIANIETNQEAGSTRQGDLKLDGGCEYNPDLKEASDCTPTETYQADDTDVTVRPLPDYTLETDPEPTIMTDGEYASSFISWVGDYCSPVSWVANGMLGTADFMVENRLPYAWAVAGTGKFVEELNNTAFQIPGTALQVALDPIITADNVYRRHWDYVSDVEKVLNREGWGDADTAANVVAICSYTGIIDVAQAVRNIDFSTGEPVGDAIARTQLCAQGLAVLCGGAAVGTHGVKIVGWEATSKLRRFTPKLKSSPSLSYSQLRELERLHKNGNHMRRISKEQFIELLEFMKAKREIEWNLRWKRLESLNTDTPKIQGSMPDATPPTGVPNRSTNSPSRTSQIDIDSDLPKTLTPEELEILEWWDKDAPAVDPHVKKNQEARWAAQMKQKKWKEFRKQNIDTRRQY